MATLAFIRGWINASSDQVDAIRAVIDESIDREGDAICDKDFRSSLKQCWHYPTDTALGADFVLLGATVKAILIPIFEAQIRRIASEILDHDDGDVYTLSGRFEITIEGQAEDQHWVMSNGKLDTSGRLPYLLSP